MAKKLLTAILVLSLGLLVFAGCAEKAGENDTNGEFPGNGEPPNFETPENPADVEIPESDPGAANYAIISVRDFGEITVRLHPEYAPNTVERFVENVRSGFYTGRNFHRVIADFMIQGGSFDGQGGGDPTVEGVFTETHPDARHYYGAFCLAANQLGFGSDSFYIVNSKDTNAFENTLLMYRMELDDIMDNVVMYSEEYGEDVVNNAIAEIMELIDTPEHIREKYAETGGVPFLDGGYTVFGYTIDGFDVIDAISAVEVANNGMGEISKPTQEIIIEWIIVKTSLD
ncbi:MAG: peptidylprolyl isomerase [Oscillospiraceae bacterium]|jgi:peptidyl-prolyl cis-trans isomerase A (cyclophilin A)/peptidyl-prolyl cis-trans isomerase B (cyclophilin B)|nr:peptidylprolyl isomerase [Oscillospiraceae bacterium]